MIERALIAREVDEQGILRMTLCDESRRNALSEDMLQTLQQQLDEAESDPTIRVIVMAAQGKAFCAGHDLKEMTKAQQFEDQGRRYFESVLMQCATFMQSIVNHPKPIIAEINGVATAAGCQLVAACDLAYASTQALFSTPGVHIGLFCSTPMVALSRNVGHKHAMGMLLTGDMVSAEDAFRMGLVNAVFPAQDLTQKTLAVAHKIASKSSMTLASGKKAFYKQAEMALPDAYSFASKVMVENMLKSDAIEGIGAFVEKRKPTWQDK